MDQGNNGLSRGDRNRNARLAALRVVLPRDHAILGIDLARSRQAAVLADHDSRVIARLAAELRCYLPEQADRGWARLRHLGARRSRLIDSSTICIQQLRDLLEVAWPAVLSAAAEPLESATWLACLQVALERGDGELGAVHAIGQDAFTAAARGGLGAWGARRICRRIAAAAYAALADPAQVAAQRPGALERAFSALGDWRTIRGELADVNTRMLQALETTDGKTPRNAMQMPLTTIGASVRRARSPPGFAAFLA
jgi:transposase